MEPPSWWTDIDMLASRLPVHQATSLYPLPYTSHVLLDDDEVDVVVDGVVVVDVALQGPPSGPVSPALHRQSFCPSLPAGELVSAGQSLQF